MWVSTDLANITVLTCTVGKLVGSSWASPNCTSLGSHFHRHKGTSRRKTGCCQTALQLCLPSSYSAQRQHNIFERNGRPTNPKASENLERRPNRVTWSATKFGGATKAKSTYIVRSSHSIKRRQSHHCIIAVHCLATGPADRVDRRVRPKLQTEPPNRRRMRRTPQRDKPRWEEIVLVRSATTDLPSDLPSAHHEI